MKTNKIINAINTSWWIDNAIIAVLYFVFSALVLKLPQSPLGSPFWPSAGIAVCKRAIVLVWHIFGSSFK
ncbi:hypothetical protein [Pseudanabaena yagii]|uniref:Uncharacterized protein n=1 Tax=Pseudanabaena yagii GIHE-NHR1 TaxID=2722753 RepID=A0ABX1LWX8_9CYAN|nr:hypothetical protein [Pseudanabaena yagii]NMF59976.1 hypothetical protein [Pseudanabaena yagii GIHE-NHR1]